MARKPLAYITNLGIRKKFVLGFSIILFLMLIGIAISFAARDQEQRANTKRQRAYEDALKADQLQAEVAQGNVAQLQGILAYLSRGPANSEVPFTKAQTAMQAALEDTVTIQRTTTDPTSVALLQDIQDAILSFQSDLEEIVFPEIEGRGDENSGQIGEAIQHLTAVEQAVDAEQYPEIVAIVAELKTLVPKFLPDPQTILQGVQTINADLDRLEAAVQQSDMSADEQTQVLALVETATQSTRAFLQNDLAAGAAILGLMQKANDVASLATSYVDTRLTVQADMQAELEDVQESANRAQVVVLVLLLLSVVLVSGLISEGIRRPVAVLTEIAQHIAAGDYGLRTNLTRRDEIGELARSVDTMVSVIQQREQELRRQTEKLRVATAQAREAARVKGEFLANMSHELRTPLNAIIGFSDILLMGISGELTPDQRHQIERLRQNGFRLLTLVNDLLDLTRIEANRVEVVAAPFNPREMAQQLASQVEPLAAEKQIDYLVTMTDPNLPDTLIGDRKRIEQIALNLLSNALKFTDQGSVRLELTANREQKTWNLTVTDTGIGIPPHALDIIFEEFRQVDGSSTRAFKGSGLGLAIARNLARMMDGQITVQSEQGQGSTFTLTLPLVLVSDVEADPAAYPLVLTTEETAATC